MDEFLVAARHRRRYLSRLQKSLYEEPTSRKDAEDSEPWTLVEQLATVLGCTPTPMGQILANRPRDCQLLGGLNTQIPRTGHSPWLGFNHGVRYPDDYMQLVEFEKVRLTEPCNSSAIKNSHREFLFLEEMAGSSRKLTNSTVYLTMYKELLVTPLFGKLSKQISRMYRRQRTYVFADLRLVDCGAKLGDAPVWRPQRTTRDLMTPGDSCFKFQSYNCVASPCTHEHLCIECGKQSAAYNDCGCLDAVAR